MTDPEVELFSKDSERYVLGALLLEGASDLLPKIKLDASDFHLGAHRAIFRTIRKLAENHGPVDALTVINGLRESEQLESAGGPAYVASLTDGLPKGIGLEYYSNQIREKAIRRRLVHFAKSLVERSGDGTPVPELLRTAEEDLSAITSDPGRGVIELHRAEEALRPQPEIRWLVNPLFVAASVNLIVGEGGTKKTFAMIDLGVCAASGTSSWIGFPVLHAPVFFGDEESGKKRFDRRLADVLRAHEISTDIPFYYRCLDGLNLTKDEGLHRLRTLVHDCGAEIVIIDSLADIAMGGDENSVQDMQPVFWRLRKVADETDAAIIVIDHANKEGKYRGTTAKKAAIDTLLVVESKPGSSTIEFQCEKSRDAEVKSFAATIHFDLGRVWLSNADPTMKETLLSASERYVLRRLGKGQATVKEIMGEADSCSPAAARVALYRLADRQMVRRTNPGGTGREAVYCLNTPETTCVPEVVSSHRLPLRGERRLETTLDLSQETT